MSPLILAIGGGLAAGAVHVLAGPDHLAAVLPFAFKERSRALRIGALWGLGHGLGVLALALVVFAVRSFVDIEVLSSGAEIVVAFLLILVGAWSIRQSRLMVVHEHEHDHGEETHAHAHVHVGARTVAPPTDAHGTHAGHGHSVLGFGLVHGIAGGSHLLGVLPAIALDRVVAASYVAAFLAGGLVAMAAFAVAASRLIRREAWLPRGLVLAGATSIAVGVFWLASSTV